jgi:serine/threonine-protein kinase HipA
MEAMMAKKDRDMVWVWLDDPAFGPLQHIGSLSKGDRGSVSFEYEPAWIERAHAFPLDPELDMFSGEFYPKNSNFGVFMDSCPDRWGQVLMKRREVIEAKEEGRRPRTLGAWEYLLGVQDCTRMGALRFTPPGEKRFLADEALTAPPVAKIAELQAIAYEITKDQDADFDKLKDWLKVLVAPGSSLGGARPKANVSDEQGHLWIAKFPSADDDYDVALWEKLLHDMARDCRIDVPKSQVLPLGGKYHTFMVERFDRVEQRRVFFASAMTMLNHVDSEDASYLELAEFISTFGDPDQIDQDLTQLFTRVVFNVMTANRDDHLRNHGFIRRPSGWRLSQAFDMNPSTKKEEHALALDTHIHQPDIGVVVESAGLYRLSDSQITGIVKRVGDVVRTWQVRARKIGISKQESLEREHLFRTEV